MKDPVDSLILALIWVVGVAAVGLLVFAGCAATSSEGGDTGGEMNGVIFVPAGNGVQMPIFY
ncbi:hypothetical protein IU449_26765 [Nocardia higoensis]|uniref:Lipoprotein n=1 Tax=Nocardia higoensis TaxID=228599 RepID=A0ABS0DI11_9NOCA|nr:hypothetical protein [Nocardia higoensis]MBF6358102.1 hypothetical protein [Nocardia higoensis]